MNEKENKTLRPVRITAMRQTVYRDLMAQFENPIEHTCDITVGQSFTSVDGKRPDGMCYGDDAEEQNQQHAYYD